MQRCRNCNSQQFEGTIFCSECGASMFASERKETTASLAPASSDTGVRSFIEDTMPVAINAPAASQPTISLVVINSGRRIVLEGGSDRLVGRKDNAKGIYPDVDLGLDGGYDAGVSRRHAVIVAEAGGYLLEDLASANGTFVNGNRISPSKPVAIRHGDELKFGTLILRFEIDT